MIKDVLKNMPEKEKSIDKNGNVIIDSKLSEIIMTHINDKNVPLVLDENDLLITIGSNMPNSDIYDKEIFTSLDDIVAVHVSSIPPVNDTIITQESSGLKKNIKFIDPSTQKEHNVDYLVGNDTIHFTLNCVVRNHSFGNDWNSYKYGVLLDFPKLDKSKILDVKSEDTYVDGDVLLPFNYFLFCPLGEGENNRKENPNACVIEYDGISLEQAISCMIVYSGHKLEPYGSYGWGKNEEYGNLHPDALKLEKLIHSKGYPVLKGEFGNALHSETKYMARRMWKREYEALISLIEYNKNNNIEMPDNVLYSILIYSGAYSIPGSVPVTLENYKETVIPILTKYGYDIDDSLFENIEEKENTKIIYYNHDFSPFPNISCPSWENTLRTRVVDVLKKSEKNEKSRK